MVLVDKWTIAFVVLTAIGLASARLAFSRNDQEGKGKDQNSHDEDNDTDNVVIQYQ
jgi:hypothetical protein